MSPRLIALAVSLLERLLLRVPRDTVGDSGLPRGWIGPRLDLPLELPPGARQLVLAGSHHPHSEAHRVVQVCVRVEGQIVARFALEQPGPFFQRVPLPAGLLSPVRVEIDSAPFFVPADVLHNGDPRQLCFHLDLLRFAC